MLDSLSPEAMLYALDWQFEMGIDEAISDTPVDRYAMEAAPAAAAQPAMPAPAPLAGADPVGAARDMARTALTLEALRAAMADFDHCALKHGARNLVFSDGQAGARVMILGEAPGRDEDETGRPFVGRAGQLLDRMLDAIGLSRTQRDPEKAVYITNVLPWRPPQNRDPKPEEIAMLLPFVHRHIELAAPECLVLVGNTSCQAMLGQRGVTRLRGHWTQTRGIPALPMVHPAYLLRNPQAKREAWADLVSLRAHLDARSRPAH